jgi:hypothetical protein
MSDTAQVSKLPACDFCGDTALYDGATFLGPWAFMCEADWQQNSTGRLGTGYGQRLVVGEGVKK